ncbi:MAG: hypothetical protein AAF840_11670 [Bacteroidota bacterium]
MPSRFPDIELIGQPGFAEALRHLAPKAVAEVDMLVIYDTNFEFLARVLNAAGFEDPQVELHLLPWTEEQGGVDLAALLRHLQVNRVILFGQDLSALGLHFQIADYFPVSIAGVTYLKVPSVDFIATAKAKGDNGPAGALWRAVKAGFMK